MNTVTTFEPAMQDAVTYADKIDNSFPYVLVSSVSVTLVSLAVRLGLDRHDAWTADRSLEDSHQADV